MTTLSTNTTMPRCVDGVASFASCTMPVGILARPLFVAERVEARVSLVETEAQAEQPLHVRGALFGPFFQS
jgi:hypothetical protein